MHKYKIRATEYPGGKEVIFQPVGDAPQRKALYLKDPEEFAKFRNGDEISFDEEAGEAEGIMVTDHALPEEETQDSQTED